MKIIENRKLFGKINIIDISIVLIILVILLIVYGYFGKTTASVMQTEKYTFQYEMQAVTESTANSVKVGDELYDNETNTFIGNVVDVDISQHMVRSVNRETNQFVNSPFPDKYNVVITIENDLVDTGKDFKTVNDYIIKVGKHIYIRGGLYAGSGYIVYIER